MSGDEPFKPAILAPGATSAPVSTRQHTIIIAWNTLFIYFLPSSSAFPARIAIRATGTARSVDTPMAPAFQGRRPVTRFPGTSIGSRDSNAPTFPHSHGLCHKYQAAYAFDCSFFSWTSAKSKRESECSHPCNVTISGRGAIEHPPFARQSRKTTACWLRLRIVGEIARVRGSGTRCVYAPGTGAGSWMEAVM